MAYNRFRSEDKLEMLSKLREKELSLSLQGRAVEQIMEKLDRAFEYEDSNRLNASTMKSSVREFMDPDEVSYDGFNDEAPLHEDISESQRQLQIIRENRALTIQRRIIEHNEALKNMEHMRQLAIEKARKEATDEMTARFFFTRHSSMVLRQLRLMAQRGDRAFLASEKGRMMLLGKAIVTVAHRAAVLSHMRDAAGTADMKLRVDKLVNSFRLMINFKLRSLLIRRANEKARQVLLNKAFMTLYLFKERRIRYFICAARSRHQVLRKAMQSLHDYAAHATHCVLAYTKAAKYHAVRRVKEQLKSRLRARIVDTKQKLVADLYRTRKYFMRFLKRIRQILTRRRNDQPRVLKYHRLVLMQKALHLLKSRLIRSAARRQLVKKHRSKCAVLKIIEALQRLSDHAQRSLRAKEARRRDYLKHGDHFLSCLFDRVRERHDFIENMKSGITYYYLRSVSHMLHLWKNHTKSTLMFAHRDLVLPHIHLKRTASKCLQAWLDFCAAARERREHQRLQLRLLNRRPLKRAMQGWIAFTQHCVDNKSRMIISHYHQTALRNSNKTFFFRYLQERILNRQNYDMARVFEYTTKCRGALHVWVNHTADAVAMQYLRGIKLGWTQGKIFLRRWRSIMQESIERRAFHNEVDEQYRRSKLRTAFQFLLSEHRRREETTHFIRAFRRTVLWPIWQRRFFVEMQNRKQRKYDLLHDPRKCKYQVRMCLRHWHRVAAKWAEQQRRAYAAAVYQRSKHSPAILHLIKRTAYCQYAKVVYRMAVKHRTRLGWSLWSERIGRRRLIRKMQCKKKVAGHLLQTTLHRYIAFMYLHMKHMKLHRIQNIQALSLRRHKLMSWAFRYIKQDYLALQRALAVPIEHHNHVILHSAMEEFRYRVLHRRMRRNAKQYGMQTRMRQLLQDWINGFMTRGAIRTCVMKAEIYNRHRQLQNCLHYWINQVDERRRLRRKERRESIRRDSLVGRRDSLTSRRDSMSSVASVSLTGFKHSRCTMANPYDAINCRRAMKYFHHQCTLQKYYRRIMKNVTNTRRNFILTSALKHWRQRVIFTIEHRKLSRQVHQYTHQIRVNDVFPVLMSLVESRRAERAGKYFYIDRLVRNAWKTLKKRANIGMKRVKHKITRSRQSICFAEPLVQEGQQETVYARRRRSSFKMAPGELQQLIDQQDRRDVATEEGDVGSDSGLSDLVIETNDKANGFLDKLFPSVSVKSDLSVTSEVPGFGEIEYYEVQVGDFRVMKQRQWVKQAEKARIRSLKRRFFERLTDMAYWNSHVRYVIRSQRIKRYRKMLRRLRASAFNRQLKRIQMRKAVEMRLFLSFKRFVYQIVEVREENRSIRRMVRKVLSLRWKAWQNYLTRLRAARLVQEFVRANVDYSNLYRAFKEWKGVTEEERKAEIFYNKSLRSRKVDYFAALFFHCQQSRRQCAMMVKAVKYHTTLIKKDALKDLLTTYRKRLIVRKKVVTGLQYLRRNLILGALRKLKRHSKARQKHRNMQISLRYEIKQKFFARAVKWTKMMVLKHVSKQLSSSAGGLSLIEKRMKVIKTLRKMSVRNSKLHAIHNWRVFLKVQRRCYKLCLKATIHFMRYHVRRTFRKLLSYCRMRRLKRKNAIKLLMLQRKQNMRKVLSKLDTNVMHRLARYEDHRLWLVDADKKAMARGFLKVLACSKWNRLKKSQQSHQQSQSSKVR